MSDLPESLRGDPDAIDELVAEEFDEERQRLGYPRCRGCGCTDERACLPGCWWVEPDLCSECADLEANVPIGEQGPPFRVRVRPRQVA